MEEEKGKTGEGEDRDEWIRSQDDGKISTVVATNILTPFLGLILLCLLMWTTITGLSRPIYSTETYLQVEETWTALHHHRMQ